MNNAQEEPGKRGSYSRREFLTNAAKIGGGLAAVPLLAVPVLGSGLAGNRAGGSPTAAVTGKVGVLLPESAIHQGLAASFMAGMELYLHQAGHRDVKLIAHGARPGSGAIRERVETLARAENVDLLVGILNPGTGSTLHYTLEALGATLIASSLGENVGRLDQHSPYVFHHTLGMWQSNWALGHWAATNLGRKALLAASFYDSGFDAFYAFRMGFEAARGQVIASEVTHNPSARADMSALVGRIRETRPDLVFASYCGQAAADFLSAYARAGFSSSLPLAGTAFLADRQVLASVSGPVADVHTALSWSAALSSAANRDFLSAYKARTGKAADAFALLGFEAAHLAAAALDRASAGSAIDTLATARFSGPRGEVAMDARTHTTSAPLYLQHVTRQGAAVSVTELKATAEQDRQVAALRSSVKTGWVHPYLSL